MVGAAVIIGFGDVVDLPPIGFCIDLLFGSEGCAVFCFLAFVDPQRVSDLRWVTLQKLLTHCKGDLILNFPASGIVRNLNIPESHNALTSFFGDGRWDNVQKDTESILSYYMEKIANLQVGGKGRAVEYLPVLDEQNHRLYDLIFATGSAGMKNALDDLKDRLEKIKIRDFRQLHDVIAGLQRQLFDN